MTGDWLTRAERAESLLNEAFDGSVAEAMAAIEQAADDYILLPQAEDYIDLTRDHVEVGINLGRMLGSGQRVFVATLDDGPETVHAFFVAQAEDQVVEILKHAIGSAKGAPCE